MSERTAAIRRRLVGRSSVAGVPLLVILIVLIAMPIAAVVIVSFSTGVFGTSAGIGSLTLENYRNLFSANNLEALGNSIAFAAGGTAVALVIGLGLAVLTARTDVAFRRLVEVAAIAPLFVSALIGALAWGILGSPKTGLLNYLLQAIGLPNAFDVYTPGGIILVFGLYYAPYCYLYASSALRLMDPQLEEASRVHGGTIARTFRSISLPLVAPAVLGSIVVCFILMIENFTVPALLGGRKNIITLSTRIFTLMNAVPQQANQAAAVGIFLFASLILLSIVQWRILRRRSFVTVSGKGLRPNVISLGPFRWVAFALAIVYLFAAVVLPLLAMINEAVRPYAFIQNIGQLFDFSTVRIDNFTDVLVSRTFLQALGNSLITCAIAAVVGAVLFFAMAYYSTRSTSFLRPVVGLLGMAPLATPGLLLGMGFLWTWLFLPIPIYGTLLILALAYLAQFSPQGYRSAMSVIGAVHKDLEDSAVTTGASRLQAIWTITAPLVKGGVVSTALLVFLLSMRELSSSLFLFTTKTRVLSITIYENWQDGRLDNAASQSIAYCAVLLVITLVGQRWLGSGVGGSLR